MYGFGHRIFKSYDPRAKIIKKMLLEFRENIGAKEDKRLTIALALEEQALKDPYFVQRNLYPNLDYYSGLLMKQLMIPDTMFDVIFAITRSIGWIAHWREMMGDQVIKIYRPRQVYVGQPAREFIPLKERKAAPGFTLKSYNEV